MHTLAEALSVLLNCQSSHDLDMYIPSPTEGTHFLCDIVNRLAIQICTYFHLGKALILI
jgi:hypothetical protein